MDETLIFELADRVVFILVEPSTCPENHGLETFTPDSATLARLQLASSIVTS
jgi:hypothetical protein